MEQSRSGKNFVKYSSRTRGSVRADEVTVELGEPGNWERRAGSDDFDEGSAMLDLRLNYDVNRDQVALRSVTASAGAGAEVRGEEAKWEHRRSRNSAISAILASSGSNHTASSSSFREGVKAVGSKVKQISHEVVRSVSRSGSSRVQYLGAPEAPFVAMQTVDSELGLAPTQMQKSGSRAEYAIQGLKEVSKATATADQRKSWTKVEARFQQLASPDGMLARSNFAECIGMKDSKEFANELYDAAVRRKGVGKLESISKEDLNDFYMHITDKSFDARIQIFYDLCDTDLDGRITENEVKQVIMLSASANKLSKLKEQASEYAALIMEELDVDHNGYIELRQLETLMRGKVQGFGKEAQVQYTSALTPPPPKRRLPRRLVDKSRYFLLDNWKRLWILALWVMAMAALFTWKFFQYKNRDAFKIMGYCLCVAKGAAETLKLNMALILFPVCRNTLTRLRSTRLGKIIPFDDNLEFHKIVAGAIAVGVFVHTTCHLTCDIPKFVNAPNWKFEEYFGQEFHNHHPTYAEIVRMPVGLTGIFMVVLMTVAMLFALHWFRRSLVKLPWPLHRLHGFNVFWYTHHLFVIVYCLLIVHSTLLLLHNPWYERSTWMYIAVPVLLYISERFLRVYRTRLEVDVVKAAVYTGNVLAIYMTKPRGFKYKSGMYLFLQCPQISSFEWHPFSITSAPDDPFLSVHIRTLGDWTAEMKNIFSEALNGQKLLQTVNNYNLSGDLTLAPRFPRLYIDGPFGAPAQDYFKYDVLLLVGLGIGATPFISILKDMLHLNTSDSMHGPDPTMSPEIRDDESPSRWTPKRPKKPKRKPKAYFYWVTREQGSFDWFRGVMRDVEEVDNKESIEMHNYLTSVYEEGDARSNLVMMLQALHHAKNGVDLVSGTRARTHFARPDWKSVFSSLAATHPNKRIGVFYCGPVALAKELETLSRTYTMKSSTKFSFHKENF